MGVLSAIFDVFDQISTWVVDSLGDVTRLFWNATEGGGSLTFLGVLAVTALGIGVVFLLIGLVQRFLHFRG